MSRMKREWIEDLRDWVLWLPIRLRNAWTDAWTGAVCRLRGHVPREMWTHIATGTTEVWCARCRAELPSWQKVVLSDKIKNVAPSMLGPSCTCNHVRLDHWGPCCFPGCECVRYQQRGLAG